MTVLLPEHSHCLYCGNPVAYGTDYCDDDCRALEAAQEAEEKKKDVRLYAIIIASLVIVAGIGFGLKLFL